MTITKAEIREFRSYLRRFERLVNAQNKKCCARVTQAQCHVLLHIDESLECTTRDLAIALNLDSSTISRTVDSLVKTKLVVRSVDPGDRRSILLKPTARGRRLAGSINEEADVFYAKVLSRIPTRRRVSAVEAFTAIVRAMDDSKSDPLVVVRGCGCDNG